MYFDDTIFITFTYKRWVLLDSTTEDTQAQLIELQQVVDVVKVVAVRQQFV